MHKQLSNIENVTKQATMAKVMEKKMQQQLLASVNAPKKFSASGAASARSSSS
jgi:hypothetical protein